MMSNFLPPNPLNVPFLPSTVQSLWIILDPPHTLKTAGPSEVIRYFSSNGYFYGAVNFIAHPL